ncbi:MAG: hypothetical protein Harvfovirus6_11 [Harvfovirus sp.]|uniref:Uncharacterized protein n=1 Tax=Harvfovirus sp. TaxID=2487768 RepID=A0A3G5A3J4_9VIRU|nr:MAG: hypothetical protein Harvfovirus6_11 [Harvfovirus sp.]
MRRFVSIVKQFSRIALVRRGTAVPLRRKILAVSVAAATALPITASTLTPKALYHDQATNYIDNTEWEHYLESPEKHPKDFIKTLSYLRYCQQNAPNLKEILDDVNFEKLINKLIDLDLLANKNSAKFNPQHLKIFDDVFGFENLPNPMKIFELLLTHRRLSLCPMIYTEIFSRVFNEDLRKQIVALLTSYDPDGTRFQLIKKMISESKNKIMVPGYSKYAYSYENFCFFASNDIVDSSETDKYFETILSYPSFSQRHTRKILNYLLALNPDLSAKKALTMILLNKIQDVATMERKTFLSSLVNKIDYPFSHQESIELTEALNESYNQLRSSDSKFRAKGFINYLSSSHPKIGIIVNDK